MVSVDEFTRKMAKLWWSDEEYHENNNNVNHHGGTSSKEGDGTKDNFVADQAKTLASLAIQASMQKLWAKELYEMDPQEREDITNEIHAVRSKRAITETLAFIDSKIQSLREYIDRTLDEDLDNGDSIVPPITKAAYKRGISFTINKESESDEVCYIRRKSFLLKFLRASFFDIEKATLRYFRCLDLMYGLFGDVALKRQLMLEDLTKREFLYLKKGQMQLLPSRDRAGRRIFAFSGREDRTFDVREKYRVSMYLHGVCSEDETTQKLGLVSLVSPLIDPGRKPFGETGMALQIKGHKSLGGLSEREFLHKFSEGCPLRTSAIHYTGPDTFIYIIGSSLILFLLGKEDRKIVRFHGGSQIECGYSLKSFGMPPHDFPITNSGKIKTKNIGKFLAARKAIEMSRKLWYQEHQDREERQQKTSLPSPGVECPEVNCVILGTRFRYNHTNLEFRQMVKVMQINREEKIARCDDDVSSMKEFVHSIIESARSPEYGFRFLKVDKATWLFVDMDDPKELYHKVSQALRDQRKRLRIECKARKQDEQDDEECGYQPSNVSSFDNRIDTSGSSVMGFGAVKRLKKRRQSGCCIPVRAIKGGK